MPINIKVDFRKVNTNVRCVDCNQPLKTNLLMKIPKAKRCFKHHVLHSYPPVMIQKKLHLSELDTEIAINSYKMLVGEI